MMDQDVTWYGSRPRHRRHCVRWGPSSPPLEGNPQFSANVRCGQRPGWTKMPLGTEYVGLGPGDVVLDRVTAPLPLKRDTAPSFRSMSFVAKRLDG